HGGTGPLTFDAATLLAGVTDADGDQLMIESIDSSLFGASLTRNPDGSITYVPNSPDGLVPAGDQFQFRLGDGYAVGEKGVAILAVPNSSPEAFDAQLQAVRGTSGSFDGILGSDADGDRLQPELVDEPRHG